MSAYFNTLTQEYPLYPGDMQLRFSNFDEANPPTGYVMVPDMEPPSFANETQYFEELLPILIDGVWVKQFVVHNLTEEQIDERNMLDNSRNKFLNILSNDSPGSTPNVIE